MVLLTLVVLVIPAIALILIGLLVVEAIEDALRERVEPMVVPLDELDDGFDVSWEWPS